MQTIRNTTPGRVRGLLTAVAATAVAAALPATTQAIEVTLELTFKADVPINQASVFAKAGGGGSRHVRIPFEPTQYTVARGPKLDTDSDSGDPNVGGGVSARASVRLDGLTGPAIYDFDRDDEWAVLFVSDPPPSPTFVTASGSVSVTGQTVRTSSMDELLIARWWVDGEFPGMRTYGRDFVGTDGLSTFQVSNKEQRVRLALTGFDLDLRYALGRTISDVEFPSFFTQLSDPAVYVVIREGGTVVARGMGGINENGDALSHGFISANGPNDFSLAPGVQISVDGTAEITVAREVGIPGDVVDEDPNDPEDDGTVTPADVDAVQAAAGTVVPNDVVRLPADVNGDGVVTVAPGGAQTDVEFLIEDVLGTQTADFNLDGVVDLSDFLILRGGFGTATTWSGGDANFDGAVDMSDFLILRSQMN